MRGKITKIMDVKPAIGRGLQTYARKFIRVTFKLEDGSWAKTDVCPEYRNYYTWKPIIRAGVETVVLGLNYRNKAKKEINADSPAKIDNNQSFDLGSQFKCKDCSGNGMDDEGNSCTVCDGAGWLESKKDSAVDGDRDAQASLFPDLKNKKNNTGDMRDE
jgi:hypothetical protein